MCKHKQALKKGREQILLAILTLGILNFFALLQMREISILILEDTCRADSSIAVRTFQYFYIFYTIYMVFFSFYIPLKLKKLCVI